MRSVRLKGKRSDLTGRGSHLIRNNVAINVEGGSDVRMTHHLLLDGHGSAHGVKPTAIGVAPTVRAEVPNLRNLSSTNQFSPHARVGVRQPAMLEWAGEDPVIGNRELRNRLPSLQPLQQFGRNDERPGRTLRLHVRHFLLDDPPPDTEA